MCYVLWGKPTSTHIPVYNSTYTWNSYVWNASTVEQREHFQLPFVRMPDLCPFWYYVDHRIKTLKHYQHRCGSSIRLRCLFFTSRPFQPKAGPPLPVKQQVGFEPGTFWSTVECFNHLATVPLLSDLPVTNYSLLCNGLLTRKRIDCAFWIERVIYNRTYLSEERSHRDTTIGSWKHPFGSTNRPGFS